MKIELKCKRCGREWSYTGKKRPTKKYITYVACPDCRTSVGLEVKNEK